MPCPRPTVRRVPGQGLVRMQKLLTDNVMAETENATYEVLAAIWLSICESHLNADSRKHQCVLSLLSLHVLVVISMPEWPQSVVCCNDY